MMNQLREERAIAALEQIALVLEELLRMAQKETEDG